ncbi:SurA N-terminal domain-containing protein [Pacificimonas sp. ICDLI1SI03]
MISALRRALRNPLMLGLLALVLVAFVIVGMGNPLGGPPSDTVAEVSGEPITQARLQDQFDRTLQIVRQENPEVTTEQILQEGGLNATLERLIGAVALRIFGEEMGLGTSKRLVDGEIASMAAFQGPTGEFDEATYKQVLAQQRIDPKMLRTDLGDDVIRRHLLATVAETPQVPRGLAEPIALYQLEQRTLNVGFVPFQNFADRPAPSEQEVEAYYQENLQRFTVPERRRFLYALIDRSALAEEIAVSDEEIAAAYEAGDDLYGASESRSVRQAIIPSQAQAAEFVNRVKAGESFAQVAADMLELTPEDLELGTLSRIELTASADEALADTAFAAPQGQVFGPVESEYGYRVGIVDAIESVPGRPLADVSDEIRTRLRREKAEARMADLVGEAEDAFADGASLAEVAEDLDLQLQSPPPLTDTGQTPDAPEFTLPDNAAPVLPVVFDYGPDEEPIAAEIGDGVFALVHTEEVIAPAPVALEQIREQVSQQLRVERQIEAAEEAAEEIVAAVEGGATLATELQSRGLPPVQDLTLRRVELAAQEGQVPTALALGFVQEEGEVRAVPDPQRGAVVVVETSDIVPGKLADAPGFVTTIRSQLRQVSAQELQQTFARAVTEHVGVERFPNALNALEAQYRGVQLTGE